MPSPIEPRALGVERDLPAVEVVAGLLARGEREVAELQRLVADQLLEALRGRTWVSASEVRGRRSDIFELTTYN